MPDADCIATGIAGVFALFQWLMPMTGWICVHTIVQYFRSFEKWIPWIALIIGAVTFGICFAGLIIGKKFGMKLAGRASVFGGIILIGIGLEIFLKGVVL
ncbi:MAG: manganese efflux pump [Lachnospiraceae bacterium]|nr:manganese efflux pump [Lachnospiraceae bacterium]